MPYMCGAGGDCLAQLLDDSALRDRPHYCAAGTLRAEEDRREDVRGRRRVRHRPLRRERVLRHGACTQCQSCALPGHRSAPARKSTPARPIPRARAWTQGSIGCGTTGKCDSAGTCAFQDGSVMCASATCSNTSAASDLTSTRFCDGNGNCARRHRHRLRRLRLRPVRPRLLHDLHRRLELLRDAHLRHGTMSCN